MPAKDEQIKELKRKLTRLYFLLAEMGALNLELIKEKNEKVIDEFQKVAEKDNIQ